MTLRYNNSHQLTTSIGKKNISIERTTILSTINKRLKWPFQKVRDNFSLPDFSGILKLDSGNITIDIKAMVLQPYYQLSYQPILKRI